MKINSRVPPNDPEIEKYVLACLIQSPDKSIPIVLDNVEIIDFYHTNHQIIYNKIKELLKDAERQKVSK